MSIESVLDRMNALQAMLDSASGPPAPAAAGTGDAAAFSAALASASAGADSGTDSGASAATFASLASPLGAAASAPAGASGLPAGTPYGAEITAAAQRNGLDPALLAGLIEQESGFDAGARSGAGAQGLTQLMPGTAAGLGVTDPLDPAQAIEGGAKYLKQQLDRFGGDTARALAAYNAGPGAVQRFGGVPPYAETQNYVRAVQANAASFRSSTPTA
ncbi:lytic transglycosylase domain-containing protein [Candidatus Solirubrobacter pratensis]|uniref:lytic transglycosylase domain-containing protein n=1 Tax=Candidatus Solirubrobacter pratensis TaxID=1298857 RepID=UPI0004153C38|nr:lytic transglycosylase domain-containing protein [Candidatus Solirubrobacter pratensis]